MTPEATDVIWVDGEVSSDPKGLRFDDHGFIVGDGAFETIRLLGGRPFAVTRHLQRLRRSLEILGIDPPDDVLLRRGIDEVAVSSGHNDGRLRLTVTGGPSPLSSVRGSGPATVVIAASTLGHVADQEHVVICPWTRNERGALVGVKSTSYAENVVALRWARELGAGEALFANTSGMLCEGTGSNIFLVIGNQLVTPPLSSGCLAGVTRALVLEVANVVETTLSVSALDHASEAFLTSSTRDIQPVAVVDDRVLPAPGPVTARVREAFTSLVAESIDP